MMNVVVQSHRNLFELGPASVRSDEFMVGGESSMLPSRLWYRYLNAATWLEDTRQPWYHDEDKRYSRRMDIQL